MRRDSAKGLIPAAGLRDIVLAGINDVTGRSPMVADR